MLSVGRSLHDQRRDMRDRKKSKSENVDDGDVEEMFASRPDTLYDEGRGLTAETGKRMRPHEMNVLCFIALHADNAMQTCGGLHWLSRHTSLR